MWTFTSIKHFTDLKKVTDYREVCLSGKIILEFHSSSCSLCSPAWLYYFVSFKMLGEKARRHLHNDAVSRFVQILEEIPHKIASVPSITSPLNKTNMTCCLLIKKKDKFVRDIFLWAPTCSHTDKNYIHKLIDKTYIHKLCVDTGGFLAEIQREKASRCGVCVCVWEREREREREIDRQTDRERDRQIDREREIEGDTETETERHRERERERERERVKRTRAVTTPSWLGWWCRWWWWWCLLRYKLKYCISAVTLLLKNYILGCPLLGERFQCIINTSCKMNACKEFMFSTRPEENIKIQAIHYLFSFFFFFKRALELHSTIYCGHKQINKIPGVSVSTIIHLPECKDYAFVNRQRNRRKKGTTAYG